MATTLFYHEKEGCTKENLNAVKTMLELARFETVYTHIGIQVVPVLPIRKMTEEEQLKLDAGVLQPDSVYIYCSMDSDEETIQKNPYYTMLRGKASERNAQFKVSIKLEFSKERDRYDFPLPIRKDLVFIDAPSDEEVGWYNIRTNILWMSDIAHPPDRFVKTFRPILENVVQYRRVGRIVLPILQIGADPEFEILTNDGNTLIPANTFFKTGGDQQVGCDGHSSTGELRPTPSRNPLGLLRNTKRLVRKVARLQGLSPHKVKVCAGGGTRNHCGGHIHFNLATNPKKLCGVLFDLVGEATLTAQTSELRNGMERIIKKDGSDSFRGNDHGFEWRTPPSWLTSEEVARAILCTSYCVTKAYDLRQLHVSPDKRKVLRELPLYKFYRKEIEDFISFFYDGKIKKLEGIDFRNTWNIPKLPRDFAVTVVSSDQVLKDYFKPVPAKLKHPVHIRIDFGHDTLDTFNLPLNLQEEVDRIGDEHYVTVNHHPDHHSSIDDLVVLLPMAWARSKAKLRICKELRKVIKAAAIQLGNE